MQNFEWRCMLVDRDFLRCFSLNFFREADEQRLQNLAQQTKTLAKQLAQEKDANRKDLTKVR